MGVQAAEQVQEHQDGDHFLVVGVNEGPGASGWEQTVHIGNMWGDAADAEVDGA